MSIMWLDDTILWDGDAIVWDCPGECCGAALVCENCDGHVPAYWDITFAGFGNGACSNCAAINTTHRLFAAEGFDCRWELAFDSGCGGPDLIQVVAEAARISLTYFWNNGDTQVWQAVLTSPYDCTATRNFGTAVFPGFFACTNMGAATAVGVPGG